MSAVLAATLTALLMLAAMPALAATNLIGQFAGFASVGKWFLDTDPCDKEGEGVPAGRGLYLLGTAEDAARERSGVWQISFDGVAVGQTQSMDEPDVIDVEVAVCGWLDRMAPNPNPLAPEDRFNGVGAACGASKGFLGKGKAVALDEDENPTDALKLYDVGWKVSAGGTLPVTGSYQEYDGSSVGPKKEKFGLLVAEVQAQGADGCLEPDGAQEFIVVGAFELINTGDLEPESPKDPHDPILGDKQCKETGPDSKDHENDKPDTVRCKDPGSQK